MHPESGGGLGKSRDAGSPLRGYPLNQTFWEAARRALPDVVEDARRAGLPPGVLAPYEAAAEAASPVASADDDADYEASDEEDADAEDASDD